MVQQQQQAQAQQEAEITPTISLELVRCLLRVSIFHVTYLRGIFPEDHFKSVTMENLEGVHDALKNGFLKNLFFGVASDPSGSSLIEEYVFSFSYDAGNIQMTINGQDPSEKLPCRTNNKANISTVKYQTCRLMRMLVQICATLDKMPQDRWLFMRLTYYPHTPEDYEPPTFKPDDEKRPAFFPRKPFSMQAGEVTTRHHAVSLKVKSILDSVEDEADKENPSKLVEMSMQYSNATAPEDEQPDDAMQVDQAISKLSLEKKTPGRHQEGILDTDEGLADSDANMSEGAAASDGDLVDCNFKAIKEYCMEQKRISFNDLRKEFQGVATGILERTVELLVEEGVLSATGRADVWSVPEGKSSALDLAHGPATASQPATKNNSQPGGTGQQGQVCLSQAQVVPICTWNSRDADVQASSAGHARTESGTKHKRRAVRNQENRRSGEPSEAPDPAAYLDDLGSQPSGIGGTTGDAPRPLKRKLSYVEKPICQTVAIQGQTPGKMGRHSRLKQMGV